MEQENLAWPLLGSGANRGGLQDLASLHLLGVGFFPPASLSGGKDGHEQVPLFPQFNNLRLKTDL